MRIVCEKCGRKMNVGEFLPYVLVFTSKKLLPIFIPLLTRALESYWASPTRSFFDDSMASIANLIELECPYCKKKTCWNPDPEIGIISKQIKQEDGVSNS